MSIRTKAIVLLISMIIIELSAVTIKQKLRACPTCLVTEKQCPEGVKLVTRNNKNLCEACIPGTFNNLKCSRECKCCEKGTASGDTNRTKACKPCDIGQQQNKECKTYCDKCPICTICPEPGTVTVIPCTKGFFSLNGKTCECCERGEYIGDPCRKKYNNQCKCSPPGTQISERCQKTYKCCAAGTASDDSCRKEECEECEAGTYQDDTCQTECKKCHCGFQTSKPGAKKCTCCQEGSYTDIDGATKCKCADIGHFVPKGDHCACKQTCCPKYKFQDEKCQSKCKCNTPGQEAKGKSCDAGGYETATEKCCNPGSSSEKCSFCRKCEAGTQAGKSCQASPCPCCKPGTQSKIGATKCLCCPENTQADKECATKCLPCPEGETTQGKTCAKKCLPCDECSKAVTCVDHDYSVCKTGVSKNNGCTELDCLSWSSQDQFDKKCENYNNKSVNLLDDKNKSIIHNQKEIKCTGFTFYNKANDTKSRRGEGCLLKCPKDQDSIATTGKYNQHCFQKKIKDPEDNDDNSQTAEDLPKLVFFDHIVNNVKNDYSIIIDKSGSMEKDTLWADVESAVEIVAPQSIIRDSDGITLYFFGDKFETYNNVKTEQSVMEIFKQNKPGGETKLTALMEEAMRPERVGVGESILVITDGSPNKREAVEDEIVKYTNLMKSKSELSISFIQIGDEITAKEWLKDLSSNLNYKEAKYDIVDVATTEEQKGLKLAKQIEIALTAQPKSNF